MKIIKNIKSAGNRQGIRIILLVLAIASNAWYLLYHSRVNPDEAFSLNQAVSLMEGNGETYQATRPQNVADIITVYNPRFPPGVAIGVALSVMVFKDPGMADFALEIVATLIFFLSWFWILDKHKNLIGFWGELFIWLLWFFFPTPLMAGTLTAHTTDTLSLSLFMASVVLSSILIGKDNKKSIFILGSLTGILSGIAASLRYLYWPMLAILPAAMFIYGLVKRKLNFISGAILANVILSGFFLLGMMLLNLKSTGHLVGYETDLYGQVEARLHSDQTLHSENLNSIIPFPLFTFGISDPAFMATRSIIENPPTIPTTMALSWILSGIIVGEFLLYIWITLAPMLSHLLDRKVETNFPNTPNEIVEFISLIGLMTVILIISTLAYLSIGMELHRFGGGWVPVMELRYYSPTFVFFTLGLGYLISQTNNKVRSIRLFSYATNIIAFSLVFFVGMWRIQVNYKQTFFRENYFTGAEQFERANRIITVLEENLVEQYPVVVIYPEKDTAIRRMTLNKGAVVCPLRNIPPDPPLATSSTVNALLVYRDSEPEATKFYFAGLVETYGGACEKIGIFTGCHILFRP